MSDTAMEWKEADEELAADVHKVYCRAYEKRFGKPYWTNGDYSKLDKETQDYDRAFVQWHKLYSGKLRAENSLLRSRVEKRTKDSERLDWLLGKGTNYFRFKQFKSVYYGTTGMTPRRAIDAAMKEDKNDKR